MDQRIFINKEKLQAILGGNKAALRKPVGYGYENDKSRALFVGTKRDDPNELQLTAKGDLQFNLKPVREYDEPAPEDVADGVEPEAQEVNLQDDNGAQEGPPPPASDFGDTEVDANADIPF